MKNIALVNAIRKGAANKTEKHYLDFMVSGQSLKSLLNKEAMDLITPFSRGNNPVYTKAMLNVFRLQQKSELETGRVMLYGCPECGDIDCGAITAVIEDRGDRIIWKDFGYETGYSGLKEIYDDIEPIAFERLGYFRVFSKL